MSWLSKGVRSVERSISSVIPHEHSADKRARLAEAKEQLDFYKNAKEEITKQNDKINQEKEIERQRLHEKQIRAMRRNFRRPGFNQTAAEEGETTLG